MNITELFERLRPWNRSRYPLGLLSKPVWQGSDEGDSAARQSTEPDDFTRPVPLVGPGVRPAGFDPSVGRPTTAKVPQLHPSLQGVQASSAESGNSPEDNELPDSVVNAFRESLDSAGLRFMKHGPRPPAEELAFAQRIAPDAHKHAARARTGSNSGSDKRVLSMSFGISSVRTAPSICAVMRPRNRWRFACDAGSRRRSAGTRGRMSNANCRLHFQRQQNPMTPLRIGIFSRHA